MLSRIPSWVKNRYVLTAFAFVLWVLFFDRNDVFTQLERARDLRSLKKSEAYYTREISTCRRELDRFNSSPAALERLAREKFHMKRDNEDEYLISVPADNQ